MFLVSIKCEYKNKIKGKLRKLSNKKIDIFTEDDLSYQNFKKYKYVITDYNKNIIEYFKNKNKIIIVMDLKKYESELKNSDIYYCSNIEDIQEIVNENNSRKFPFFKLATQVLSIIIFITVFSFTLKNTNTLLSAINESNKNKEADNQIVEEKLEIQIDHKKENYLFLGDSITEFYKLEDYYDKDLFVVNSGISGNSAYNILSDMYNRVYKYNPTKVFLLIGTNDLSHQTDDQIINNILDIVSKIHIYRKNAEVYVESIYPVNNNTEGNDIVIDWMVAERDNERIKGINKVLKEKSKEHEYTYLDFYSKLEDEKGRLKLDYTTDGLHISDEGYKLITKEIMKIINSEKNI